MLPRREALRRTHPPVPLRRLQCAESSDFAVRAFIVLAGPLAFYFGVTGLATGCALRVNTPPLIDIPTPDHPRVGCIGAAPDALCDGPACRELAKKNRHNKGQRVLMPEIVLVVGVTSVQDGERWKVLRQGERDPEKWLPYRRDEVVFDRCGAEADAYREVMTKQDEPVTPVPHG